MTGMILHVILAAALIGMLLAAAGCTSGPAHAQASPDMTAPPGPGSASPAPSVLASADSSAGRTLVAGIDGDYRPFSYLSPDGSAAGFDVDSMKWIAEKEGLDVRFEAIAWDDVIPALRDGRIDIVCSAMTITPERQALVNFSTPYWQLNHAVVARNDSALTYADVEAGKAVVGAQRGSVNARWVEKNLIATGKMDRNRLKLYGSVPAAVDDLLAGNVDALITDDAVLRAMTKGKPVRTIGTIPVKEDAGIAVRKTDPGLLATIDKGLARLKADPYWQELIVRYDLQ